MTTASNRRIAAITMLVGALALAGCAVGPSGDDDEGAEGLSGELVIFAAASLSAAFDELSARFEAQHPDIDVRPISYDGSSALATQLIEGAAADVFASADERTMAQVVDGGLAAEAEAFATNTMQIAVAPGNPEAIGSVASLAHDDLIVVMCAAEVPCGTAAHTLLDAAGADVTAASEEQNVTAVLAKVKSGEADAGLVYRTDIAAAGDSVDAVDIAGAERAPSVYPLSALTNAANPAAAEAFVAFVLSSAGQSVLRDFEFGAP